MPLDTTVVKEAGEAFEGAIAVRMKELASAEKQLEFEAEKLEIRKREMDHEFALKKIE